MAEVTATEDYDFASPAQQIAQICVLSFSAVLSLAGSISILTIIARKKKREQGIFHRILCGISAGDIIATTGLLFGPYMEPPDDDFVASYGTTATCSFNGVLVHTFFTTVYYNMWLAVFYYSTVVGAMKEEAFSKQFEKWIHTTAIGVSVIVSTLSLSLKGYNPVGSGARFCGVNQHPIDCEHHDSVECTRGLHTFALGVTLLGLLAPPVIISITLTSLLCMHVKKVLKATQKYQYEDSDISGQTRATRRQRQVAVQAVVYCAAFVNIFFWGLGFIIFDRATGGATTAYLGKPQIFFFTLLHSFFLPLQGSLNFLVFARPRFLELRKQHQDKSFFYAFKQLYVKDDDLIPSVPEQKPSPKEQAKNDASIPTQDGHGMTSDFFSTELVRSGGQSHDP